MSVYCKFLILQGYVNTALNGNRDCPLSVQGWISPPFQTANSVLFSKNMNAQFKFWKSECAKIYKTVQDVARIKMRTYKWTGILRKLSYIMSIHNSKNSDPPLYWWFPHNSVSRKYSQLEVKSNSTPLSWLLQRFSLYRCWWRHHFFFAVTVIQILSLFLWWVAHIRGQSEVE